MLTAAAVLTLAALVVDLTRVVAGVPAGPMADISAHLRFWRTVACVAVCWLGLRDALDRHDTVVLLAAMTLCIPADAFLILMRDLKTGIAVFLLVQLLLMYRFARLIQWSQLRQRQHLRAAVMCAAVLAAGNGLLGPRLAPLGLALPVLIYSTALLAACLGAWLLRTNPAWPTRQAQVAFIGMVLFVLCDITVGLGAALGDTPQSAAVRAFTGLFYTPCLALLALSGRRA